MPDDRSTRERAWNALRAHRRAIAGRHLRDLFDSDPGRAGRHSIDLDGLLVDYSKHRFDAETLSLLFGLAGACGLGDAVRRMFAGERINRSEDRPALHVALRNPSHDPLVVDGEDVMPGVHAELGQIHEFSENVRGGRIRGWSGAPVDTVVNIGIGGSDLGPRFAVDALYEYRHASLRIEFAGNVDSHDLLRTLDSCSPERTLFIVASKTFTTLETLTNAGSARRWLAAHGCPDPLQQFVAVTANPGAAGKWGIAADRIFRFQDWVGGRYSVWSAVGLPLAIAIGADRFREFLSGAHVMDRHFESEAPAKNIPVVLGLLDAWYGNCLDAETLAIVPYDQRLRLLPEYLGQLVMESNGKRAGADGGMVDCRTSPVVWGSAGTNAQHAYFQMLHQGTHLVPIDFLAQAGGVAGDAHHTQLLASCIAQSRALMIGRDNPDEPHRHFPGNQPSTTMLYERLDPKTLGMIIALYEHRTFVQAVIFGVNPFDQWGVELGKDLTRDLIADMDAGRTSAYDSSTTLLLDRVLRRRNRQ
jgi:glucose-6-phosphate isomerase